MVVVASSAADDLGDVVVDRDARADLAGEALAEVGRRQAQDVVEEPARRAERELGLEAQQVVALQPGQHAPG